MSACGTGRFAPARHEDRTIDAKTTGAKQTDPGCLFKTPLEWVCNGFPRTEENAEVAALQDLIATLNGLVDTVTEADSSALGTVLHVAHILVTLQGEDGHWPAALNLRTGKPVGAERSRAPVPLFHRLNDLLRSTEFARACHLAENGRAKQFAPAKCAKSACADSLR